MRILLDECVDARLRRDMPGHTVQTVSHAGWAGVSNGKLLRRIGDSGQFDVFLTMDKNLPHQNRIRELPFAIVVLRARSNRLEHVRPLVAEVLRRLPEFQPGRAHVLTFQEIP
jgi:predicted nuclease of predicted toxin-antitoxin system